MSKKEKIYGVEAEDSSVLEEVQDSSSVDTSTEQPQEPATPDTSNGETEPEEDEDHPDMEEKADLMDAYWDSFKDDAVFLDSLNYVKPVDVNPVEDLELGNLAYVNSLKPEEKWPIKDGEASEDEQRKA